MDIGFVWDESKYSEVQEKHQIQFHEAVAAFEDPNGFEIENPAGPEGRSMYIGSTYRGRVLVVVYSEEDLPIYRLITVFDAEGRFLYEYRARAGI